MHDQHILDRQAYLERLGNSIPFSGAMIKISSGVFKNHLTYEYRDLMRFLCHANVPHHPSDFDRS